MSSDGGRGVARHGTDPVAQVGLCRDSAIFWWQRLESSPSRHFGSRDWNVACQGPNSVAETRLHYVRVLLTYTCVI